jgi:protein TonB
MLTNLLESRPKTQRSIGGSFVSLAMHAALIVLAIQATLHAGQPTEKRDTPVEYTEVKHDEPVPPKAVIHEVQVAPPKGFQTLTAPVNIPDVLPAIDLSQKPTNELDWIGKGAPGGRANGVAGVAPAENQIYLESQVEKPVMAVPGSPAPRYPDILKAAGVEGEVVVSFVVDTTGRADAASIQIVSATNELFGAAVRTAIPSMRFLPAATGGRKVKQKVQQPFVFTIIK